MGKGGDLGRRAREGRAARLPRLRRQRFLDDFDAWRREEQVPDTGNLNPKLPGEAQWDSERRIPDLEDQGVVAEVLFPNGLAFVDRSRTPDALRTRGAPGGDVAYNRWLVDFCAEAPGRRGQGAGRVR